MFACMQTTCVIDHPYHMHNALMEYARIMHESVHDSFMSGKNLIRVPRIIKCKILAKIHCIIMHDLIPSVNIMIFFSFVM